MWIVHWTNSLSLILNFKPEINRLLNVLPSLVLSYKTKSQRIKAKAPMKSTKLQEMSNPFFLCFLKQLSQYHAFLMVNACFEHMGVEQSWQIKLDFFPQKEHLFELLAM